MSQEPQEGARLALLGWYTESLVAEMAQGDRSRVPYLVGVVVRVANHTVQPVRFLRAKGTKGCRRLGVFTSANRTSGRQLLAPTSVCVAENLPEPTQRPELSLVQRGEGGGKRRVTATGVSTGQMACPRFCCWLRDDGPP